jgi:integrase
MNALKALYTRQKNELGQWRYERVNVGPGRRRDDLQGPFYTRILGPGKKDPAKKVQSWHLLDGETLDEAKAAAKNLADALDAKDKGLTVAEADRVDGTNRVATKVAEYLNETKANKSRKTWQAYSNSLAYFTESCSRQNVQDVTRKDLLDFKTYLRAEKMSERSVHNNFGNIATFLKWANHSPESFGVNNGDWPAKPEREPEAYTEDEITKLLTAAKPEERLLLKCFLASGLRSGEMAHLTYGDIDFKHSVWTVQPKKGWTTKTKSSQRDVPVLREITEMLRTRMETNHRTKSDLIFFNRDGKPNNHMLRIVKRVAKRAKVSGRVDDHKFRSTAITLWLRAGRSVTDVKAWVGHRTLQTLERYAAKVNVRRPETVQQAGAPFAQYAAVGD